MSFGLVCLVTATAAARGVAASPELVKALQSQLSTKSFPAEREGALARSALQSLSEPEAAPKSEAKGASLREQIINELPQLKLTPPALSVSPADVNVLRGSRLLLPTIDSKLAAPNDAAKSLASNKSLVQMLSSSPSTRLLFDPAAQPASKLAPDAASLKAAKKLLQSNEGTSKK